MKRIACFCFATFIIFLFYLADVQAPCCGGVCHSEGKCCDDDDNPATPNVWYIGCKSADENIFCPNDVFPDGFPEEDCLFCMCSSQESCNWVDGSLVLCSHEEQCEECSYDNINSPSYSKCVPKECADGDSDCDGELDEEDKCPDTPPCAEMDPEIPGCSVDQAERYAQEHEVPGLGINVFSFFLVVLVLSALLVYNFERIS